jgi:uncharacterized protein (TIGR02145 family)
MGYNYQYSGKLLCAGQSDGILNIEKVSDNIEVIDEKTAYIGKKGKWVVPLSEGDILKYTGYSGNYGTVITDIPTKDSTVAFNFIPCGDGDYYYLTVRIGTQIWMADDLKTIKLNDGTPLNTGPNVPLLTPAFVGSVGSATDYGRLYNWYAVNTGKLCPEGWHVPSTFVDWGTLSAYIGGDNLTRGGKLKETGTGHWIDPNHAATNEVGFTARPGGYNDSNYHSLGYLGFWWTSDAVSGGSYAEYICLSNTSGSFMNMGNQARYKYFSVRCIKNN